mgnify:CR=1 FL=1
MKQIALLALGLLATLGVEAQTYKFDFTTGKKTKDGYTKITPADRYSEEKGYGYDRQPSPEGKSTAPFFFSVTVPDGNNSARRITPPFLRKCEDKKRGVKILYIRDQQAQHTYFGKRKCAHQTA